MCDVIRRRCCCASSARVSHVHCRPASPSVTGARWPNVPGTLEALPMSTSTRTDIGGGGLAGRGPASDRLFRVATRVPGSSRPVRVPRPSFCRPYFADHRRTRPAFLPYPPPLTHPPRVH